MSVVGDLLAIAFDGGLPPLVDALVDLPRAEAARLQFAAGPILTVRGEGAPRAYVASTMDPAGFRDRVARALGDEAGAFLATAPTARAMVDTDGTTATLFLDDLHAVEHGLGRHGGHALMCATWRWPDGERTTITRHGPPPRALLPAAWQRHVDDAHHAGLAGIWGVRWRGDEVVALLWIDDARWHGDPERSARVIDREGHPAWRAARARAAADGLVLYADGVEIREDGAWQVTCGLAPRG